MGGASNMFVDVQRGAASIIEGKAPRRVDWEDYNYPPGLRLVHIDLEDLDGEQKGAAQLANAAFLGVCGTIFFQFLSCCIRTGYGAPGIIILYALMNIVVVCNVGLYAYYNGYKGLVTNNNAQTSRYLFLQALIVIFCLVSSLVYGASWCGWLVIPYTAHWTSEELKTAWQTLGVIEGSLWMICMFIGGIAMYRVHATRQAGLPAFNYRG